MPAALLPVVDLDADAVQALQKSGIDYSKFRYQGLTAMDFAKRVGNSALMKVLGAHIAEL